MIDPMVNMTCSTLEKSIFRERDLTEARAMKMKEGQLLMEAAASLHNVAHRLGALESLHLGRDTAVASQLSDTNSILEGAFVKLNDYVRENTSSTAKGVKTFIESAMPFLPVVAYCVYESLRVTEEEEEEDAPEEPEETYEDILWSIE